ncbi:MAG: hypothetical protein AB9919_09815 [Geobacteraceae bacterium]
MGYKDYLMIITTAIAIAFWPGSQMAQSAWAIEPAAPLVVTNGTANASPTSATLKGTFRPRGFKTDEIYFEYGTTTSYGSKMNPVRECKKYDWDTVCDVYGQVTNLKPQQTYHFRLVVKYLKNNSNQWQMEHGADKTFSTHYPPTASTGEATEVTSTSAVLHGTANPNGTTTDAYFYYQKYCVMCPPADTAAGHSVGSGTNPATLNVKITGLAPGTKYMYRLRASSKAGSSYGEFKTFFTPTKPIVATTYASAIKTHGATLGGTVNPAGLDTKYYFEYGDTASYGTKKSPVYAGKGVDADAVSLPLPNSFTPGRLYHYRIVASNTMGVSYGEDRTFSTEKLTAPSAMTGTATDITLSTATLNGVVNPHNDQAMWHFEYRKAGADWKKTENVGVGAENDWKITAKIWSLDADTTYSYKLMATNGAGTVSGQEKTFKTAPLTLPTATTGLVKNVTKAAATVTGTINPNDTPTSYWFWYGTSTQYTYHTTGQIGLTGKNVIPVSADLIGLAPDTTYYYRISANNVKGAVQGEDKTFRTAKISQAPVAATSQARNVTSSSATIGGTVNPNGLNTTYHFQYGTSLAYGSTAPATPPSAGSGTSPLPVSTALSGLKANTTYYYRLVAVNSGGTINGANMTFKTTSAAFINVPVSPTMRR